MDVFASAERLMRMDDTAWARHASSGSIWTRIPILPLLALAIWSRVWLGWWVLVPVLGLVAWTYLNPRAFPPPQRTDTWAAKGTFGERVWLNRKTHPVPAHHGVWVRGLTIASALGMIPLVWGLWALDPGWTVAGLVITVGAKVWFVDRCVWIYEDMIDACPEYRSWLRRPGDGA